MFCIIRKFDTNISSTFLLFIVFVLSTNNNNLVLSQLKTNDLVTKLAHANNDFGLSVFGILSTTHGNQIISPISLLSAFAMLYNGANGSTRSDLGEFLKFNDNNLDEYGVKESFKLLYKSLMKKSDKTNKIELNMFNGVLSHTSLEMKSGFEQTVRTYFRATVILDDFKVTDSLTDAINQMIKTQTNDKIEKLIESRLDPQTQLMIFNAVYFRGIWQNEFREKDTKNQFFWNSKYEKEKIKMMSLLNKEFNYVNAPGILNAQIIELPYVGKTFSMIILLPREREGLIRLKLNLNSRHVTTLLKQMTPTKVNLFLPKFKFSQKFSLKDSLKESIGQQLFSTGADFSRISDQKNLVLNEILHKVVIEVNEKGTEAAAVTGIGLVSRSMEHEDIVQFKVDRPFLYFVSDRRTGMMLFLGQVTHLTDYDEDIKELANNNKKQKHDSSKKDQDEYDNQDLIEKMKKIRYGFNKLEDEDYDD